MFATEVSVLSYSRKEMKPLFLIGFMFVTLEKRDFVCFDLFSRSFCGHVSVPDVVSDLFRCQEDVKPLRDLALCLLKERG